MKGICIGYKGAEQVMQKEIDEIIKSKGKIEDSVVIFNVKDKKDICKLCYLGQSFSRVLQLLDSFSIKKLEDMKTDVDFSFLENKKFVVKCERIGEHDFSSVDAAAALSEKIIEKVSCTVDFSNPEIIIYAYVINEKCYVGIDYCGFDLSKRDYKVYLHPKAIKGTLAYIMLRIAGYDKTKILLDPFCGSGIIPIEAAFFSTGFPINTFRKDKFQFIKMGVANEKFLEKFDKKKKFKGSIYGSDKELRHINASKQNAKIGGIEKSIKFSRIDVEWLDTKFKEKEIDLIVTDPPFPTKWKKLPKTYEEFFYQAEFVLKDKGKIVAVNNPEFASAAHNKGFKLEAEMQIQKKNQFVTIGIFKKEKFK
ncbi:methyltransferase [Candidatus Woesearchaeota archaeon]|nr:methyltransferase [Candidatus Woesearchaeota archaeon]